MSTKYLSPGPSTCASSLLEAPVRPKDSRLNVIGTDLYGNESFVPQKDATGMCTLIQIIFAECAQQLMAARSVRAITKDPLTETMIARILLYTRQRMEANF